MTQISEWWGPMPGSLPYVAPASVSAMTAPHWTLGDRLAAFAVLLPAESAGPVVLALSEELAVHLQAALPGAFVLAEDADSYEWPDPTRVVRWDGRHLPLVAGSAGLVVVDARLHDLDLFAEMMTHDGALAVVGTEGQHVIYPSAEHPELVWHRDWPVHMPSGPVPWVRRRLGLTLGRRDAAPRLNLVGRPRASLADEILQEIQDQSGLAGELVGVIAAGHVVLRVRRADGDVAVRLSLTDPDREVDVAARVRTAVPEASPLLAPVVAQGRTRGHPWVATEWTPRRRRPLTWAWPSPERQWGAAESLAAVLATRITGATESGWAARWLASADVIPDEVRTRWETVLRPLDSGLPTTWCHGDLWPANVLLDGQQTTVIDWDNASDDALQGLDVLLLPALRGAGQQDRPVAGEIMRLVDEVERVAEIPIGGRLWGDWERPMRQALAVAAVVLYLRNRSLHDLGVTARDANVAEVDDALLPGGPASVPAEVPALAPTPAAGSEASRTARGAVWLGTSGIVVKASQTVVLLTLAAMLAPSALGLVALGTLVANISVVLTSLGTASALVYWRGDVLRAARTATTIALGMGILMAGLLWVSAPFLASTLRAEDGGAAVIRGLTVTLPFLAVAAVTNELLRRELRFLRRIIPDSVSSLVGAAVAIVLVSNGYGVMALVIGQIVQGTLTLVLCWVVHPPVLPGWNREDARGLLSYGGPYAGANLLELVQLNVDYVIVARVLGSMLLGQYSLSFRLAYMPYLMIVVVCAGAAFPYLCRRRGPDLGRSATFVMTGTLTLLAPACVGLLLFAGDLELLGDKWAPGVPVVAWLAVYAVLLSIGQLVQTALNAAGRPGVSMGLRLLHLVLLLMILLVVATHGIVAVAVAQVGVAAAVCVTALLLARRHVDGFSARRLGRSLRPTMAGVAVMVGVVVSVRGATGLTPPSLPGLLIVGGAGAIGYAVTVWLLDRDNLKEAANLLRRTS